MSRIPGRLWIVGVLLGPLVSAAPAEKAEFEEITPAAKAATERGIKWLLEAQNDDGGFGVDKGSESDIACTSIVGLAFLAEGSTPTRGPHCKAVRRILDYVLKRVDRMGADDIAFETSTQVQVKIGRKVHSFFSALFLSQVLGEVDKPERVQEALKKLVRCVERAQEPDGSWGAESWAPVLGTAMGWSALRGAHFAGIAIHKPMEKTSDYLLGQLGKGTLGFGDYKDAAGMRVLFAIGKGDTPEACKVLENMVAGVRGNAGFFTMCGGEEYLSLHLLTECCQQVRGPLWKRWFTHVRDGLIQSQNADGTWTGSHCITGRTFCTAAALLILQAPNRLLPFSQQ